jgi:hypothetical protein
VSAFLFPLPINLRFNIAIVWTLLIGVELPSLIKEQANTGMMKVHFL